MTKSNVDILLLALDSMKSKLSTYEFGKVKNEWEAMLGIVGREKIMAELDVAKIKNGDTE